MKRTTIIMAILATLFIPAPALASTGTSEAYLQQAKALAETERYGDAERTYLMALREADAVGQNNPKLPDVLDAVGDFFRSRGNGPKAEEYYRREITIKERASGAESMEVAKIWRKLGQIKAGENDNVQAEQMLRTALAIYERKLDRDRAVHGNKSETQLAIADCLDDISRCVAKTQGQYAAEPLQSRATAIRANPNSD